VAPTIDPASNARHTIASPAWNRIARIATAQDAATIHSAITNEVGQPRMRTQSNLRYRRMTTATISTTKPIATPDKLKSPSKNSNIRSPRFCPGTTNRGDQGRCLSLGPLTCGPSVDGRDAKARADSEGNVSAGCRVAG
jgi:hypothetical protein